MAGVDELRELVSLLQSVLLPFQETQNKQSQLLALVTQQIQRIVDMAQSEPTRQTIIDALREITEGQSSDIIEILEKVKVAIDEGHRIRNQACDSRHTIQKERDDTRDILTKKCLEDIVATLKAMIVEEVKPAKTLAESWDRIKWELRIAYSVAVLIALVALWMWHNTPAVKAAVAAAGAHAGP